jgi:hypothetical protein
MSSQTSTTAVYLVAYSLKLRFNDESLRCTMYIEEAKKERFVSFTRVFPNSSQGSDWMPQLSCIIVHNHVSVALWLTQQLRFTLTVAYEAA